MGKLIVNRLYKHQLFGTIKLINFCNSENGLGAVFQCSNGMRITKSGYKLKNFTEEIEVIND